MEERNIPEGISYKDYVNTRFEAVNRAVDLALESARGEAVPLRQFIEAILDEQRRGMVVAEQEREKAAKTLRNELARAIDEGDKNLREHISQQVQQIRAALIAAEQLETSRFDMLATRLQAVSHEASQHVEQLRRERELVTSAQQGAIDKAEIATEKRFESVNEFRQSLTDQTAQFIRREVFEARVNELSARITTNTEQLNLSRGSRIGINGMTGVMLAVTTLILGIIVVVVNIFANG